jgi:ribosomal protein S9
VRDVVAGLVAAFLALSALSLATALHVYRRKRQRARDSERALGRAIVAEIPAANDLVIFSEDDVRFYWGERSIDKDLIIAVRVLINGSPIAACVSRRYATAELPQPTSFQDREEGIARDRWDVAIETVTGTVMVPCGAIRERVSQELARTVFDAVKREVERLDLTTRSPRRRPGD